MGQPRTLKSTVRVVLRVGNARQIGVEPPDFGYQAKPGPWQPPLLDFWSPVQPQPSYRPLARPRAVPSRSRPPSGFVLY